MIRPGFITLAVCLLFGQVPSFASSSSLEARQGPVDLQALKAAPLGRRNLLASGMLHHGHGMHGSSHGQDSYDPQQGSYNYGKETSPSANGKHDWGKGTYDLGTGTHHTLEEGNLYSGDGGYNKGSDPETKSSPKPNASGNYGPVMSDYSPEYQDPNTKDNAYDSPSKSYESGEGKSQDPYGSPAGSSEYQQDSGEKSPQEYNQPPAEDKSKVPGEKNYNKKAEDPQNSGKGASTNGKQSGGYQNDKGSGDDGSFVFEEGTTEEQRKAAQDDAKKNGGHKKGDSHGGESKPSTYSGNQGESQPDNSSGQTNGDSPYA